MSIRLAVIEDYDNLLKLATECNKETSYSKYDLDEEKIKHFLNESIDKPTDFLILVVEHSNTLVGLFFAIKSDLPLHKVQTSFAITWYVLPKYRTSKLGVNLFKSYEYWSKDVAKTELCQVGTTESKDLTKLYKRMGYTFVEKSFLKENR